MKIFLITALFLTATLSLTACGVKPKQLEKPADKQDVEYPRTYPNPVNDPAPVSR